MRPNYTMMQKITKVTEIPKDILGGVPVMTVTGESELCLENHTGIIEYTDLLIRIKTKTAQLKIIGKNLQIEYYTNDEIKIFGRIDAIEFRH